MSQAIMASLDEPWSRDSADVLSELEVDLEVGLDAAEVVRRVAQYGPNQLAGTARRRIVAILADQFKSVVILLLVAAATLAILFADFAEGVAIFAVILINTTIGFVTEWRATRSMEALSRLGRVETVVMRDGIVKQVAAESLVPGDIVLVEGGDVVTADMRVFDASKLQADESTLTGESLPVSKQTAMLAADTPVMERSNLLFKGTSVTRGTGRGVVVGTGSATELGRISELVSTAEAQQTPLEMRLDALAHRLVWVVLCLAVLIGVAGILAGRELQLAIEVAIALSVAAIPEGLPIVATIALARGMYRMARKNALIARLSAVETLGATSVILTDKTGTLTENHMSVTVVCVADADISIEDRATSRRIVEDGHELGKESSQLLDELLSAAALCNSASLHIDEEGEEQGVGDPTEIALLAAAERRAILRPELLDALPLISQRSFDPAEKLMATMHQRDDKVLVAVKGAPEAVIQVCDAVRTTDGESPLSMDDRNAWLDRANALGARGLRTLAVARRVSGDSSADPYASLVLLGVVGLEDPPRQGISDAVARCRDAGIAVIMVTGDHEATARNIAAGVGIIEHDADSHVSIGGTELEEIFASSRTDDLGEAKVFSRVTPEQKLNLIAWYQDRNQIVAMTGDGVNDAPALKKADIGIAMGIRGTDVAKEAAPMVLQDDEFGTIVEAVAQGRAIYENIRKFVIYLLSCNISEVLVVTIATVAGAPLPLLPLQILFLNLVTDVFPALALGVGEGSPALMKEKPRPAAEGVLTPPLWLRIGLHGLIIAATVLSAMAIAVFWLGFETHRAVSVSFCTLALAQIWHVFNMRDNMLAPVRNEITQNPWIWVAVALCIVMVLSAVYVPWLGDVLELTSPGRDGWMVIMGMSVVPMIFGPVVRVLTRGKVWR